MKIIKIFIIFLTLFFNFPVKANDSTFEEWLKGFKIYALKQNISETTYNQAMSNIIFLPKVLEYDRFQPEFYEDTHT